MVKVILELPSYTADLSMYDKMKILADALVNSTELKQGKWIYHMERNEHYDYENEWWECPICHYTGGYKNDKYCSMCGSEMVGDTE